MSSLDDTFAALADPTRRAILAQLRDGEAKSLSNLANPFAMSLPGVMKHVKVLEEAGLLRRQKTGRTVHCQLQSAPMNDAIAWLEETAQFWNQRLDALADLVETGAGTAAGTARKRVASAQSGSPKKSR